MPYRRLPNTDQARLRALKTALDQGTQLAPMDLAYSQKHLLNLRSFLPKYEQAIQQYHVSKRNQTIAGKQLADSFKMARMYVSHFLQTLNMCIARGEFKSSERQHYGLSSGDKAVPEIGTEPQLIEWGQKTIQGEAKRTAMGGTRLFNPSIAKVKVYFELFLESYHSHKDLVDYSQKMLGKVAEKRGEADRLILDIWNETEAAFEHLNPEARRKACGSYGLVYIFRPYEKKEEDGVRTADIKEMEPSGLFR